MANFDSIITDVTFYGNKYNPSKGNIKLPALNTQLAAAKTAVEAVSTATNAHKLASDARDVVFLPLSSLITKVINALKATDTTKQVIETAETFVRKIQGRRATPKKTDEQKKAAAAAGEEINEISSSQMGFDNRIANLEKFFKLLSTIAVYVPNETELKVATLNAVLADLKAKNTAVVTAEAVMNNARISRNEILYKPDTGMVDTAIDIKSYIKSLFGATSPQYKKISGIKFTKPRKK